MDIMFLTENMRRLAIVAMCCLLAACGGNKAPKVVHVHATLPEVRVPGVISDPMERLAYVAEHYWDGLTDSLNLDETAMDQAFGVYTSVISAAPAGAAAESVRQLYGRISAIEAADTSSGVFETVVSLAEKYFYDPNSPVRDEEFYLQFAENLASSQLVPAEKRWAYAHDAEMCRLNRPGTVASDFGFIDSHGRSRHLHGVEASNILLLFSNPGCHACGETIAEILASPFYQRLHEEGLIRVVNIYPDEDMEAWKAHLGDYPEDWITGFDDGCTIKAGNIYSLRAIPSLYLLDKDKRVILKDATIEKLIQELQTIG